MDYISKVKLPSGGVYGIKDEKITDIISYDNAGAHNSIFRGKYLGSSLTTEQSNAIKAGTFDDIYIGDYWVINGTKYFAADCNYFRGTGDTECTTNHLLVVPEKVLYYAQMHNTDSGQYDASNNTTAGGYVGSDMYTKNLANAKTKISTDFGSGHVLSHRLFLTNAVHANGYASGDAWYDSTVDLMTEEMVYGSGVFHPVSNGSAVPANYRIGNAQIALFKLDHSKICIRAGWWLQDVVSAISFAYVNGNGLADSGASSPPNGVRPAFCIY